MPDANVMLRDKAFWFFYQRVSDEPLEGDWLNHFGTVNIDGREYPQAVILVPCGAGFSLQITISPEALSVSLALWNREKHVASEMGWWDEARWHPHALRWSELVRLHQYWTAHPDASIHPSAAFLLLARFVGNGADDRDEFAERRDSIRRHYERLQLFADAEITRLSDNTFVLPPEDDYNWTHDDELGWVFGGEYPCYSIRNREHSGGSEGTFPFADWSAAIDQLPSSPGAT